MNDDKTQKKEKARQALQALDSRERHLRKNMVFIICASYFLFASQNMFLDSLGIGEGLRLMHQAGAMKFLFLFMGIILLPTTLLLGGFFFWYLGPMEQLYRKKFRGEPIPEELAAKGMSRFNRFTGIHNVFLPAVYLLQTLSGMSFADKNGMGIFLDIFPKFNFALELMIFSWVMNEYFALRPFRLTMEMYRLDRKPPFLSNNTSQTFFLPLLFLLNGQIVLTDGVVKMFMGTASRFQVHQETFSRLFKFIHLTPAAGDAAAGIGESLSAGDPQFLGAVIGGLLLLGAITLIPALAVFLALAILQKRKLNDLGEKVSELSRGSGDLTRRIRIQGEDELGLITSALNDFIENLRKKLLLLSQSASRVTQSTNRMNSHLENTSAATEEMAASVNQINRTTVSRSETVSQTGEELLSLVESLDRVSSSVENQAAFVDQTSSAVNQMAASISSVTLSAKKASDLSRHLREAAKEGEKAVTQSIGAVRAVENSSEEVNSLVALITETSETTNLLAMNAAIEAAHAGEAGKGFAVVADEVRRLAVDSSDGARQITGQVQTMVDVVGRGVKLSEEAGVSLGRVIQDVEETSQVMEDIALAMDEQNTGANEILKSITSLVDATSTIREVTAEQKAKNEAMRRSVDLIVQAFTEIKTATDEQAQGTREIVNLIEALQDVAGENREIVDTLEKAFAGFKLN